MVDTKGPDNMFRCVRPQCATRQAGQLGFTSAKGLALHVQRVHEGMGPGNAPGMQLRDICPYCDRRFVNLSQHIRNMHPREFERERRERDERRARVTAGPNIPQYVPPETVESGEVGVVAVVEQLVKRPMTAEERQWVVDQVYNRPVSEIEGPVKEHPVIATHTMRVLPFVVMMDEDGGIWHCERVVEP